MNSNTKKIVVSGMIRSGTTLISRIINAHSKIRIGSDLLLFIFKLCLYRQLRYKSMIKESFDKFSLSPGYQDNIYTDTVKLISKTNLNIEIKSEDKDVIKSKFKETLYMEPDFDINLNKILEYQTYGMLIDYIYNKIAADQDIEYVGTKEAYFDDFKPWLDERYPGNKYIHIIRNPLAIYSSIKNLQKSYPLIYILHHWRKHIAHAVYNQYKHNALIILYEDLCKYPEKTIQSICSYLDLSFESDMLVDTNWSMLNGKQWVSNSSYKMENLRSLYVDSLDKWKEDLTDEDMMMANYFCYGEINKYYPDVFETKIQTIEQNIFTEILLPTKIERSSFSSIINEISYTKNHLTKIWEYEQKRNKYLQHDIDLTNSSIIEFFLNKEVYRLLIS